MRMMFVDESGDLGKSIAHGEYFVMVGVVIDRGEIDVIDAVMENLRRKIGWQEEMEFKFAKTRSPVLRSLARAVDECNYRVYAVIVDKTLRNSENVRLFYNQILVELVRLVGQNDLKIVIDGKAGKKYRKTTATYVRQKLSGRHYIRSIQYRESQKENILQIADLFAGYIHSRVTRGRKSPMFKDILTHKITEIRRI